MGRLLLFMLFCAVAMGGRAQQNYFVYLQTDNKQPFYVKVNDKILSSSSAGYLVIPKLANGSYTLSVGFPKNEWPQQIINLPVANKDQGYFLKNFDNKGWGLFNMQTMEVLMANNSAAKPGSPTDVTTRTDAFSTALADVVNTPSIKEVSKEAQAEKPIAKPAAPVTAVTESKTEPVVSQPAAPVLTSAEPKKEEPVTKGTDPVSRNPEPQQQPLVSKAADTLTIDAGKQSGVMIPGMVKKISETSTAEAVQLHYLVQEGGVTDTVQVILPVEALVTPTAATPEPTVTQATTAPAAEKTTPAKEGDPKFIDIELANPNSQTDTAHKVAPGSSSSQEPATDISKKVPSIPVSQPAGKLMMINSDCKSTASEEDFLKIRKRMVAQKTEEEMIVVAEKQFRQKCFSTEQVRNLSILLLKEESKYKFFDKAYPFVYDSSHFKNLETQLSDPYFISRFRAMIRN